MKRKLARFAVVGLLGTGLVVGPSTVAQAASWSYAGTFSASASCQAAGYAGLQDYSWSDFRCYWSTPFGWELWIYR